MQFKFNINDYVKVKLTSKGIRCLENKHDALNKKIIEHGGKGLGKYELKLDKDGYYRTQMWCLIQDFGEMIGMGVDLPFETNIILLNGAVYNENKCSCNSIKSINSGMKCSNENITNLKGEAK